MRINRYHPTRDAGPAEPGHRTTIHTASDGGTHWECSCGKRGGQHRSGHYAVTAMSAHYHTVGAAR